MLLVLLFIQAFAQALSSENEFLTPWTVGPNKDYSQNRNYNVGVHIIFPWSMNVIGASMTLLQDNRPDDPVGGPGKTLETGTGTSSYVC